MKTAILLLCLAALICGCADEPQDTVSLANCNVAAIVDGDTVRANGVDLTFTTDGKILMAKPLPQGQADWALDISQIRLLSISFTRKDSL